jgi:SHS2 domain-containing protein
MQPAFTILDHPADLGIEARGASLAEAFQNAALGLMSIILDLSGVENHECKEIALTGPDHGRLLVKWLSEILYLYDGQGFVCKEFAIHRLTTTSINAILRGEMFNPTRHTTRMDVKAVTYHQLVVREDDQGGLVRVYLDI